MLKVINNIPIFVWPLFVLLLIGGLKARKTNRVSFIALLLIPAGFFSWSFISFLTRYAGDLIPILLWFLCLGIGCLIGFSHTQRLPLRFDQKKKMVEMPGSWIPLMLSMSIFTVKFSIALMRSLFPDLNDSMILLGLELFSTILLGIFVGRGGGCFLRYKSHEQKTSST